jgi:hypothetical protein
MVRAAIGRVGYPPGGKYPLKDDTAPSPSTFGEPRAVTAKAGTTTVALSWTAVPGASGYHVYRSDLGASAVGDASGTSYTVRGLTPNKRYTFYVAARTGSGQAGPKSAAVTATTLAVKMAKPRVPAVSSITRTSAKATCGTVVGATGYNWYLNGVARGHSDGPSITLSGLKPNTSYTVTVSGDTQNQAEGPRSAPRSFKTRK